MGGLFICSVAAVVVADAASIFQLSLSRPSSGRVRLPRCTSIHPFRLVGGAADDGFPGLLGTFGGSGVPPRKPWPLINYLKL